MIFLFPKSKSALALGLSLSFLIFAAFIYDGIAWYYAAAVLLGLSLLTVFICELFAALMHRRFLSLLYGALKPKEFVELYSQLLKAKHIRQNVLFSMKAYLSNGYAAMGNFTKALSVLSDMPSLGSAHKKDGEALIAGNRCSIYLYSGSTEKAKEQYELLEKLIDVGAKFDRDSLRILDVRISLAESSASENDADFIREKLKSASSPLHRLELKYFLGMIYYSLLEKGLGYPYLKEVAAGSDELWIRNSAKNFIKK